MQRSDDFQVSAAQRRYLAVAQTLLAAIQQGRFEPGSKLPPDREVAKQLGVSRPTAREAILVLELLGAITVRHGDGTYISEMHHRPFDASGLDFGSSPRQLLEARIIVEPPVSGLLARHANGLDLDSVQGDLDAAVKLVDDLAALPTFVDLAMQFHARLTDLCTNRVLSHMVSDLVDVDRQPLWALLNQMALQTRQSRVTVIEEHQRIVDAVRAGDAEAAEHAMRAHLHANKRQLLLEDLSNEETAKGDSELADTAELEQGRAAQ
jgi:DNA-binding FadR family transcriptional regulator